MSTDQQISAAKSDEELLSQWLKLQVNKAQETREAYRRDARAFLQSIHPVELRSLTLQDLTTWVERMADVAPATQARRISAIRNLLFFAYNCNYVSTNFRQFLNLPKVENTVHERIAEREVVQDIIRKAKPGRNRTLVRFLYITGCRATEAVQVRFKDLQGTWLFLRGKGGKVRTIQIPLDLANELRKLRLRKDDEGFVFRSERGRQLHRQDVTRIVSASADDAGYHAYPHILRHSHCTHSIEAGAPIHLVQATVGHKNVSTTSRYLHARPDCSSTQYINLS